MGSGWVQAASSEGAQVLVRDVHNCVFRGRRLQALEDELEEDIAKSYLVVRGYIAGSENVFMETMDVDSAKAWCNSHADCKGFTFGGDMERPEDEVAAAREATAQARATDPAVLSLCLR